MSTAFKPFTTANAVSSMQTTAASNTGQAPSPDGNPRRHHRTPGPRPSRSKSPPPRRGPPTFEQVTLHSRRTAAPRRRPRHLPHRLRPRQPRDTGDSLLQTLHQDRLTLTGWAERQAAPTLTEINRHRTPP